MNRIIWTLGLISFVSAAWPAMAGGLSISGQTNPGGTHRDAPLVYANMDSVAQTRTQTATNDPAVTNSRGKSRAVYALLHQYSNGWLWSLGRR